MIVGRLSTRQNSMDKIERTFGWLGWSRIFSKEYERTTESSESDFIWPLFGYCCED
jgi:hypothetical protein